MIKASGTTQGGRPLLVIGLSAENVTRLLDDQPITFDTDALGLPGMQVLILGGRTEDDIRTTLLTASVDTSGAAGDPLVRRRWTATLAPLGMISPDSRTLHRDFELTGDPRGRYVRFQQSEPTDLPPDIVGHIGKAWIEGGWLHASGSLVALPEAYDAMKARPLTPELVLDFRDLTDTTTDERGLTIRRGRLTGLMLSHRPPMWPGQQFTITEEPT